MWVLKEENTALSMNGSWINVGWILSELLVKKYVDGLVIQRKVRIASLMILSISLSSNEFKNEQSKKFMVGGS